MEKNYFSELNKINVSEYVEMKNGLSYLSWAWAWSMLKERHPDAFYTIYENDLGWCYHTDGRTCWVKTGVTVGLTEHIEYLPVMDFRNKSIPLDNVTSFDVNKAIQRSLTKALARHGLGLYIYAGEDIPMEEKEENNKPLDKAYLEALNERIAKLGDKAEASEKWLCKKLNVKALKDIPVSNKATINSLMEQLETKAKGE